MAWSRTTQDAVLQAVVARLRSTDCGLNLNESSCFQTIYPVPPDLPPGDQFVTVAPAGGRFRDDIHEGGGIHTTAEEASCVVTIFIRNHLDRSGRSESALGNQPRSVLYWKLKILRALSGHDLQVDGSSVLHNLMAPLQAEPPEQMEKERMVFLKLHFSTDFFWDLE